MSTDNVPEPPKAAHGWLDLLKKANDLNIVPLIGMAVVGYLFWQSGQDHKKQLEASEARTRAALVACAGVSREENSKTRAEVRSKAADLQNAIGSPTQAAPPP